MVVALKHGHGVAELVELVGGCEPRRPAADNGHALSRARVRRARANDAHLPALVRDRVLDLLDGHRLPGGQAGDAGALTRRRAHPTRGHEHHAVRSRCGAVGGSVSRGQRTGR